LGYGLPTDLASMDGEELVEVTTTTA